MNSCGEDMSTVARHRTCLTCAFAEPVDSADDVSEPCDFTCRRMPPHITSDDGIVYTEWPLVNAFDWCGEYQPQEYEVYFL